MREKYLLGATKDSEIVFGELEITTRNGYPELTASFDTVRPFTADSYSPLSYYESLIDEMDKAWKYDQCEHYDCSPSELAGRMADDAGDDPRDTMDCSLYPEEIDVDGTNWYFESSSGGQHDARDDMAVYTNKDAYDRIHALWDEYHLKHVDEDVVKEADAIRAALEGIDEEEWIADYIRETF
jgi:hypothetical protein